MHPQFTQVIHAAASTSASTFITEETTDASADASTDIPRNLQASAADARISEVKEYLKLSPIHKISLTPTSANSCNTALGFSVATASYGDGTHTDDTRL
jgi:hypothetical protein